MIKESIIVVEDFVLRFIRTIIVIYVIYSGFGLTLSIPSEAYMFTEIIGISLMITAITIVVRYVDGEYDYFRR